MPDNDLEKIRGRIGRISDMLLEYLGRRMEVALEAEEEKRKTGLKIYDPKREATELARVVALAKKKKLPLDEEAAKAIFRSIFRQSRRLQGKQRRAALAAKKTTRKAVRHK